MEADRPCAQNIYEEAERILKLPAFQRDLVLADIWILAGNRCLFDEGEVKKYIEEVEEYYVDWDTKDFSILYYVITGEEVIAQ